MKIMDQETKIQAALRSLDSGQYKSICAAAKVTSTPYSTLGY